MKREREKHITRLHIILFFLVVIAGLTIFFLIKNNTNNELIAYHQLEKDIAKAAYNYVKTKDITVAESSEITIPISALLREKQLSNELTNECKGYAIIENYKNLDGEFEMTYNGYINCGKKYSTDGYNPEYE